MQLRGRWANKLYCLHKSNRPYRTFLGSKQGWARELLLTQLPGCHTLIHKLSNRPYRTFLGSKQGWALELLLTQPPGCHTLFTRSLE